MTAIRSRVLTHINITKNYLCATFFSSQWFNLLLSEGKRGPSATLSKLATMVRAHWMLRAHAVGQLIKVWPGVNLGLEGSVTIGDRVSIYNDVSIIMDGADTILKIGSGTYIQPRSRINVRDRVEIGSNCAISWDVDIMDTDSHGIVEMDGTRPAVTAAIVIEDRVWIGASAKILKGVRIGHDSVVAAGAVVTKSFPPHSILAGVPARRVKEIRGWTL